MTYLAALYAACDSLRDFPKMGRAIRPGDEWRRSFVFGSHRIWYRLMEGEVEVAAITHSKSIENIFD